MERNIFIFHFTLYVFKWLRIRCIYNLRLRLHNIQKAPETGKKAAEKELQTRRKAGNKVRGKAPETGKKTSSGKKNTGNPGGKAGSGAGKPRRQ